MVYVVPLVCFVVPLILGLVFVRNNLGWLVPVCLIAGAGGIYWAILRGQQEQGWDGMGYAIFAFLMVAPGMLGMLIGGIIGWIRARRARA